MTPEQVVASYLRARAQRSVLLFTERFASPLEAPGGSYLGGLPKLPPGVAWPHIQISGQKRALLFAGQIDLADASLLELQQSLPRTGTLYFFYQDTWEMPDSEDGIMPCSVIYHSASARDYPPSAQPAHFVPLNTACGTPPRFLAADDPRRFRSFRFNLSFLPYVTYPDWYEDEAFRLDPIRRTKALEITLARHPNFPMKDRADAYLAAFGVDAAWEGICRIAFGDAQAAFAAESLRSAIGNRVRELKRDGEWWRFEPQADWILAWFVIGGFARAILTPDAWTARPRAGDSMLGEAAAWLERARGQNELAEPPADIRTEFLMWIEEAQNDAREPSLSREILRYAVHFLSEKHDLQRVPKALSMAVEPPAHLWRGEVQGVRLHSMLGHGSSDHAAIAPEQRQNKTLLLKLEVGEGQHHFWIDPKALAKSDFSHVELTC